MQNEKEIITAIAAYLEENLSVYHDGYTETLGWKRFVPGMIPEIATEISAVIAPYLSGAKPVSVVEVGKECLKFNDGTILQSDHDQDCCEQHFLSFQNLSIKDFEGLVFDLSKDSFFNRIEGFGIELIPLKGWPIRVPGYGSNNGYYSQNLSLVLSKDGKEYKRYEITECQEVTD